MMNLDKSHLRALEATAVRAATYLDECDDGANDVRLDPGYYRSCGELLFKIFSLVDARHAFPALIQQSASAREMAESIEIGRRIELSRLGFYPQLAVLMNRAAA